MPPFTTRPEIVGTFGVVASTHWIASSVGMGILERGGNAFDAAVATAFALQVIEPHLNGPGGDATILLYDAKSRRTIVVCGQGSAPKAATIAKYRSLGLDLIPGAGLLAAVIPGSTDAWLHVLATYGTMKLADVLAPAIHYAAHGFPVLPSIAATIRTVRSLFANEWKSSAEIWLSNGEAPQVGTLHRNETLAGTYRRLIKEAEGCGGDRLAQIESARIAWSQGFVAEAIDKFTGSQGGLLTGDDIGGWRATEEAPATLDYGRYTVAKAGPWSQGPVMLQQLALLSGLDLAAMDPLGPDFAHTFIECAKLAFADREAYYGDPNFIRVPLAQLLDPAHNARRRGLIGSTASLEDRPSAIDGFSIIPPPSPGGTRTDTNGAIGEPTVRRTGEARGDTVHLDVVDRHGNMVAATPSGGWLQSSPAIPGLGFCLGSRAQMFWLRDGHPSALAPGKRPRTTLSPTIVLKDGKPYMALGTPGGDGQDQWPLIAFLRHVHHGMNLQEAIDSPVFHTEHFRNSFYPRHARPGVVVAEGRLPPATIAELKRRGHTLDVGEDWSLSRASAVAQDNGVFRGGASPRGMQGYAVGR